MKCPSCGNYAKTVFDMFIGFSALTFKCQYCNDRLRGNAIMILSDILSVVLYAAYVLVLVAFAQPLAPTFGELTFPLLGAMGILGIRGPCAWLAMKAGRFINVE